MSKKEMIKNLLKVIRIETANSNRGKLFTELPMEVNENSSIIKIIRNRWYHHPIRKLVDKYQVWNRKRKGKCTCECHWRDGFYHCWDVCCDNPNDKEK